MPQNVLPCPAGRLTSPRTFGVVLLVIAAGLWSLTGLAVKQAMMEPFAFAVWRALGAAATAAMVIPWTRGARPHFRWTLLATVLNAVVAGTVIWTMTRSTAARGILLQYTGPIFCALLARVFLGRRLTTRSKASLTIAAIGIGIMVSSAHGSLAISTTAAGILCGLAYGALILVLEKINQPAARVNPFAVVLTMNLGTAALFLMISPSSVTAHAQPQQWLAAIGTGVLLTAIPYVLFQLALRRVHAVDAALITLLEPVLNPVWVAIGTAEFPDRLTLLGGGTTLAAAVVQASGLSNGKQDPPATSYD